MRKATLSELNVVRKMIKHHIENTTARKSEVKELFESYEKKVDDAITDKLRGLKINDLRELLRDIYTVYYIKHSNEGCNLGFSRISEHFLAHEIREQKREKLRKILNSLSHIEMQIVRKEPVDLDAVVRQVDAIIEGTTP